MTAARKGPGFLPREIREIPSPAYRLAFLVAMALLALSFAAATIESFDHWGRPPGFEIDHTALADAWLAQGEFARAADELRKVEALAPQDLDAMDAYARALLGTGDAEGSLAVLARARDRRPGDPRPHEMLGNALYRQGRIDAAVASLQAAVRLLPGAADRYAAVFVREGEKQLANADPGAALEAFERALELEPADAAARRGLGLALGELGRHDEAVEHLGEAVRRDPADVVAREALAKLRGRAPDPAAPREAAEHGT